ncbi:WhiB family transcriptional regulator [Actinomadura nitritigenes]|uniref:WhiB family transcriptional regulator n=1 Tax=Actinomadura nitritigenes TaxID=134602 RepID=UPI003D90394D
MSVSVTPAEHADHLADRAARDHARAADALRVDQPWRSGAACQGQGLVMDPPAEEVKAAQELGVERLLWRSAKELCWSCGVYDRCQAWVLSLPKEADVTGVCGGMTEGERRRVRRKRAAESAAQEENRESA